MFNEGDKATVTRGKAKGEVTILAAAENGQYAVRDANGGLHVVKADSIKAPAESTISEGDLAREINTLVQDAANADQDAMACVHPFVQRLASVMPGLGARIAWPAESASE